MLPSIGDAESVIIKVKVDAKDAENGLARLERVTVDKFGVMTKKVTEFDKELNRSVTTVTKHNEMAVDQIRDFAKKNATAIGAIGVAIAAVTKGFELANFAAKKVGDEGSREFLKSYGAMQKAAEGFRVELGEALMPVMSDLAKVLGTIVEGWRELFELWNFMNERDVNQEIIDRGRGGPSPWKKVSWQGQIGAGVAQRDAKAMTDSFVEGAKQFGRDAAYEFNRQRAMGGWQLPDIIGKGGKRGGSRKDLAPLSGGSDVFGGLGNDVIAANQAAQQAKEIAELNDIIINSGAAVGERIKVTSLEHHAAPLSAFETKAKGPSVVEQVFGPLEQINGYKVALEGLTTVASAGFDMVASGAELSGKAVLKSLADVVAGLGKEMLIRSIAAYASGNFWAGTAYAGGAAAAMIASREINQWAGGGSRSTGSAASYASSAGAGRGGGGAATRGDRIGIVTIDSWDPYLSERQRQQGIHRAIRRSLGSGTFEDR